MSEILIVDDNPSNLDLLGQILRNRGHRVRAVTSGRRALESARIARPDLVLLDITMPEMDGFETCAHFKEDPGLASVPVIFISALEDSSDKVKAFSLGGADYISKPFQAEEAVARVDHQLRILALQRELEDRNRALGEALAGLQELGQLKSSFTAMLVHDLRSPLTGIMGILDLIEDQETPSPSLLARSRQFLESAVQMLNDLMEIFRSEEGGITLARVPVAALEPMENACGAFTQEANRRGVLLDHEGPEDLPEIFVDPQMTQRILANLLGNALKYTPPGGRIHLEAARVEGAGVDLGLSWIRYNVTDNGCGIPADQLPYIFDPYRQASRRDAERGYGLGLAIVQRLMAAHDGRVQVCSQIGVGSTFSLYFPLHGHEVAQPASS